MAVWPSIPFFVARDGWQRTGPENAVLRTDMETGPAKQRRRTTAAPKRWSGAIPSLTAAELASFETFFDTTLQTGALSFTATDPADETVKTFRFVGGYRVTQPDPGVFRVAAELEVLPS
ncbi:hypothetical protein RGUI_0846 [Rhodovulum sp. P5]|uniref:virion structural protein n=1 Tax=Rhodovulum phage vB_RhkS_P1 TaxID=1873452 RepID=UPI00080AC2A9|nr:hypothetical protein [Rhodovulum sp. P5]YP_009285933.1 virion structural protein [Rhodovulum phage vB_RhkS_P1]ANT39919.1 hypothetical protein Rhks_48 [Rhodovulum phage vB_RhkS_P1]ARE38987.1 hypothetical protein RGUI_0846 [Rhodovulum sp. P5]